MLGGTSARRRGIVLVFVATILWSSAGFFARLLGHLDLWTMLSGRAFFGGLFMLVPAFLEWRRGVLGPRFGFGPASPLLVALSAIAIGCYVAALHATSVAEVMVIYATLPFVAAGLVFLVGGEKTTRRTLIAAGVAFAGVIVMVASAVGTGRLPGQIVAFAMTLAFALMIVIQRRYPALSMTSTNALAALAAAAAAYGLSPRPAVSAYDLAMLALFGLATVCLAFFLFMEGAKHIPAAESGLITMLDVVLGPSWVYLAFGETPAPSAVVGGALVLGALVWRLAPEMRGERGAATAG